MKEQNTKYTVLQVIAAKIYHLEHNEQSQWDNVNAYPNILSVLEEVTALPLDHAKEMVDTIVNGVTLRILKGLKVSPFVIKVSELLQDPNRLIPAHQFNILTFVPSVHDTFEQDNKLIDLVYNSKHVGVRKENVILDLKILSSKIIHWAEGEFCIALALDADGHFYSFNPKKVIDVTDDFSYKIKAKIKDHIIDKYTQNAKVTRLNYVKELT